MRKVAIAVGVIILAVISWQGVATIKCNRKNTEFARRMGAINSEARRRLPLGAGRSDVVKFLEDHQMDHFTDKPRLGWEGEAIQGSRMVEGGCAPFGCGTDRFWMVMRVKLSPSGTVAEVPSVEGIYADCL